ncbi:hypothetical protein V502_02496 [Pseudogymnoascus sp. VKM F-4520 (FW-2644)]|nr:hypothetical protein V502_02496 [Pseudogymnoascus sp. VKM F-4520 (FW-2644)]
MLNLRVILLGTTHPHIFHRYKYLAERTDIEVLGYYEKDDEISLRMQPHTGCHRYTSLNELLALSFDGVLIHGYDCENAYLIKRAIDAGAKGIFVEKPGASQPADFFPLAEEITRKGIVFEVGWQLHYTEPVRIARQIVTDKILGSVTSARFHGGCPGGAGAELWQSDPKNLGGFFYSLGGHTIETIIDLFSLPQRLVSSIRKLPPQPPHTGFSWMPDLFLPPQRDPTVAVGTLTHEDISSAILEYPHFNVTLDFTAWEPNRYCEEWAIEIYGTRGTLHLVPDPPSGTLLLRDDAGEWKKGRNVLFEGDNGNSKLGDAFQKQMGGFFDRVAGKRDDGKSCDEKILVQLLRLYEALYKSARFSTWESF